MKRNALVLLLVILVVTGMLLIGRNLARRSVRPGSALAAAGNVRGQVAPDFELETLEGKKVHLSDYRGKAVLLNFWATWCPPCKIEMPWFVELQKQYGPQGFVVLGVAMDDAGKDTIAKFTAQMGLNYPTLLGSDKVADSYGGVDALPTTFYIGRDGKIVSRVFGLVNHSDVEDNIRAALKQGTEGSQVAETPAPASTTPKAPGAQ